MRKKEIARPTGWRAVSIGAGVMQPIWAYRGGPIADASDPARPGPARDIDRKPWDASALPSALRRKEDKEMHDVRFARGATFRL